MDFIGVSGGVTDSLNCLYVPRTIGIPNGIIVFEFEARRLPLRTDSFLNLRGHASDGSECLITTDENPRTRVADASEGVRHTKLGYESVEGGLFEYLAGNLSIRVGNIKENSHSWRFLVD